MTAAVADPLLFRRDVQVIGLVGLAHGTSHFFHLILAPLFPWLKEAFHLSYSELGFLVTIFFIVSGVGQALAGFLVDRIGAYVVLVGGMVTLGLAALILALADSYVALIAGAALTGLGNSIFHPADYTLLNKRVSPPRMSHAFSFHGIAGMFGWATAPVFLVAIASAFTWRSAYVAAALVPFVVTAVLLFYRASLNPKEVAAAVAQPHGSDSVGNLDFMRLPAVWMCFGFFALTAMALGGVQHFAPTALRESYGVGLTMATALVTVYMLASAVGTLVGGFLAARYAQHDRIIAGAFIASGLFAFLVATGQVPPAIVVVLFALIGFGAGIAGPSRDLLVRAASPRNATGRVYGVVYSGLDIGLAIAPLMYGASMDHHHPLWVFALIGIFQMLALFTALGVSVNAAGARRQPA